MLLTPKEAAKCLKISEKRLALYKEPDANGMYDREELLQALRPQERAKNKRRTPLTRYRVNELAKHLNITIEAASVLREDPATSITLSQLDLLNLTYPPTLTKAKRNPRSKIDSPDLPKNIGTLWIEALTPITPYERDGQTQFRIHYKRRVSKIISGEVKILTAQAFLEAALQHTIAVQKTIPNHLRRVDSAVEADIRRVFGAEYDLFLNLILREPRVFYQIYGYEPEVKVDIPSYYDLWSSGIVVDHNYQIFPNVKTLKTACPQFIPDVIEKLTPLYEVRLAGDVVMLTTANGHQDLAYGVKTGNEIVFTYPVDENGAHVLWHTPFINLTRNTRIILDKPVRIVNDLLILGNGRWVKIKGDVREVEYQLRKPIVRRTEFPENIQDKIWQR